MSTDGKEGHTHEQEADQAVAGGEEFSRFERHQRCINWASLVLNAVAAVVVLAGVYVANKTLRSINESVVEAGRSAAAAEGALEVSMANMRVQNGLFESSRRQMDLMLQQIEDARDALWLQQRAWVNHRGFVLQVREENGDWSAREIKKGDEFRIRCFFENVGVTPATNILFRTRSRLSLIDGESPAWREGTPDDEDQVAAAAIMSGQGRALELSRTHGVMKMNAREFEQYSSQTHGVFIWSKVSYCDLAGRFHWARVGIMRHYGRPPDEFDMRVHELSPTSLRQPDPQRCPAAED